MPANEAVWRNLRSMHIVFAVGAGALFLATWMMMSADFNDEWREIQRTGYRLAADQLAAKERKLENEEFEKTRQQLEEDVAEAEKAISANQSRIQELEGRIAQHEGHLALLDRQVKFMRAERDKTRADLDLKIRDGARESELKPWRKAFSDAQSVVDDKEREQQRYKEDADKDRNELAALLKPRDEALAALKKHTSDAQRLERARQQIEPEDFWVSAKRKLMELPIIEGFNGHLKPNQLWLPELTINYGGMRDVARFDRCITCHVNIDKIEAGNVPAYPFHPQGHPCEGTTRVQAAIGTPASAEKSCPEGFRHPYATHPKPELYLTDTSPHPMQKFGCTGCHEGQGSGTSFVNASHSPNSPDKQKKWEEKYGWFNNHFWEYPMLPARLAEASCVKCHHNVVELGVNPKFGASAPKLYKGYELVRKYGCFGCHEINGYNAGKPIGPDMRLEPQTEEERQRIASDPSATAGTMPKVGPGLRHFKVKVSEDWAKYWIQDPKKFRPDTRMPQFFGLSNQSDKVAHDLQPVEIAGISAYLMAASKPIKLDKWDDKYQPNAERGKLLFSQRGCLSCHSHEEFPGIKADFGPNLSNVHAKIRHEKVSPDEEGVAWLYTWIREPSRYSKHTKMPDLYLDPEGEGEARIDPAADIVAYLLAKPQGKFDAPEWKSSALDELVRTYLKKVLTEAEVEKTLRDGRYPRDAKDIKGDEIELAGVEITEQTKLAYIGRRSISRYGCYGCHDIPGFEKARPIGTALQDWGRKDPAKLALEHIGEFLHHKGEPDGKSTAARVERLRGLAEGNGFASEQERDEATGVVYFYDQLLGHGRAGFLWQKLRDPRSYDYKKVETKGYDDRLRMPRFPFDESEIEAIATFVLGLVAEPPIEKYQYRPQGVAKSRIEGEKLIAKFNCNGCHMLDLPKVKYAVDAAGFQGSPKEAADHDEALSLLMALKPPQQGLTGQKTKSGKDIVAFHGMLASPPDMEAPEDEREYGYSLWETLKVGDKVLYPSSKVLIPMADHISHTPGRGGEFAEWLVDSLMKASRDNKWELSWQMAPPPLYKEGMKVQTPWLYRFIKNPTQIRYTTVLRMPKFNMTNEEAEKLANYFSAVDGSPYPYQDIPQREASYFQQDLQQERNPYLRESWKLLNGPICIKCHQVGGQEYKAQDPKKDVRGPNLDRVQERLRPDWLTLWIYKPNWILPYTSMPVNFPKDKPQFPELFGGEPQKQVIGVRDALLNYHHLLEKEGRITPPTAAAPAKPAAGDGGN